MKYFISVLILFFQITFSTAQSKSSCPIAKEEKYKKVMSSAFAKDYEKCPVIITAEYFKEGYLKDFRKPSKLKEMYFFQCVNIGDEGTTTPGTNEMAGDFYVIDKDKAEQVLDLKKGDKVKLTGTTYTQKVWGTEVNTFFIVANVEIIK
jgi:hypothetical protein